MQAEGISSSVQVQNVPGAGGTVGLAQFASTAKGDAPEPVDLTDVDATVGRMLTLCGPNGRVLELGVGTGRLAVPMAAGCGTSFSVAPVITPSVPSLPTIKRVRS